VEPVNGTPVRLDFRACATFDITEEGMGQEWSGPVWFEIAGTELGEGITIVNSRIDPTEGTACTSGLGSLLEEDALANMPPVTEGPIDISVRYQTPQGEEHRHAWRIQLRLTAPEAPPEIHQVRNAYNLFQKVVEQVPGSITGHFLDLDRGVLYVYLTPSADPEGVRPMVEEVFGSELPSGGVQVVVQGDYPLDQLAQWYREARNSVEVVEGLQFSDLDERLGRIEFGVQTEYAAHQTRKALARTGVPQDAVAIEVASPHRLDDPPVQTDSPIGVGISLDFPPTVQQGQAIPIEVVLTNEGDETVRFEYNPPIR
jgi:hypothetical protein